MATAITPTTTPAAIPLLAPVERPLFEDERSWIDELPDVLEVAEAVPVEDEGLLVTDAEVVADEVGDEPTRLKIQC